MIKAMIAGQRDPEVLAALARAPMKAKHDALVQALDGMFDDHHGELAGMLLDQIAALDAKIAQLGARAAELTARDARSLGHRRGRDHRARRRDRPRAPRC